MCCGLMPFASPARTDHTCDNAFRSTVRHTIHEGARTSTNLLYNWYASLRAEIAHACEPRRSEHARAVCSAGRSRVQSRALLLRYQNHSFKSAKRRDLVRSNRALCPGRSDWFASLRAEIAHACELRRSEHARAVCSAGRSRVQSRALLLRHQNHSFKSAERRDLVRSNRALCPGRSDWFASLRAEIAHACELKRSEHARAVCSAGRSRVQSRALLLRYQNHSLSSRPRGETSCVRIALVPRPERLVCVVASGDRTCM
jgi:hypothetical protein